MRLSVIEGGRGSARQSEHRARDAWVRAADVEAEAERRRREGRVTEWRVREYVTGTPMPPDIKYLELQIDFAARAICRLSPIPADFADDLYWPMYWND